MTRKDYIALAGFMRDMKPTHGGYTHDRWHAMVIYLSDICKRDNPRFDAKKFLEACQRGFVEQHMRDEIINYHTRDDAD